MKTLRKRFLYHLDEIARMFGALMSNAGDWLEYESDIQYWVTIKGPGTNIEYAKVSRPQLGNILYQYTNLDSYGRERFRTFADVRGPQTHKDTLSNGVTYEVSAERNR